LDDRKSRVIDMRFFGGLTVGGNSRGAERIARYGDG